MRRTLMLAVAVIFLAAILALTTTYTVRFTENAVLTTFGRAGEGDVITEPGLKFKWPEPIQSVTKYDRRGRFLAGRLETQQTADSSQITVEAFCTWEVGDPLEFFKRFSHAGQSAQDHYRKAEDDVIRPALRSALSETSKFAMNELFSPSGSKLPELEARVKAALVNTLAGTGITVTGAGISGIVLPEKASTAVFERMKAERTTLIESLQTRGDAQAQKIIAEAEKVAKVIEAFAQQRAEEIRARGNQEATQFVTAMNENPELAIFLREVEFMKNAMGKKVTLFFQTDSPGFQLFSLGAGAKARSGQVPGMASEAARDPAAIAGDGREPAQPADGPGTPVSAAGGAGGDN